MIIIFICMNQINMQLIDHTSTMKSESLLLMLVIDINSILSTTFRIFFQVQIRKFLRGERRGRWFYLGGLLLLLLLLLLLIHDVEIKTHKNQTTIVNHLFLLYFIITLFLLKIQILDNIDELFSYFLSDYAQQTGACGLDSPPLFLNVIFLCSDYPIIICFRHEIITNFDVSSHPHSFWTSFSCVSIIIYLISNNMSNKS